MQMCQTYVTPSVDLVRLQLEGVIAVSNCPGFKNNTVYYVEYETEDWETPENQDVIIH